MSNYKVKKLSNLNWFVHISTTLCWLVAIPVVIIYDTSYYPFAIGMIGHSVSALYTLHWHLYIGRNKTDPVFEKKIQIEYVKTVRWNCIGSIMLFIAAFLI